MLPLTRNGSSRCAFERAGTRVAFALAAFFATGVISSRSAAESAQSRPSPPSVVPPKPLDTSVTYPEGATGDASVVLELTVNEDGTVGAIGRAEGPEPFATSARIAAATWKFAPALRDGKPVRARIRFEARFIGEHLLSPQETSQPPAPAERPAPATTNAAQGPPPEKEPAYSVTVHGQRAAPGGVTVSRVEAQLLPGSFGDPFRAVGALPGVTPVVSLVPLFFLRGAPPGNVGYFIDGIRVPALFHALVGPPVIAPAFIDRVDVYPGSAPARYGRYAGGIIAAETAPTGDALHAEGAITVLDLSGVASTPFDDGRAHVTAAGRLSTTQLTVSKFTNLDVGYWDYQLHADYDVTQHDVLSVFAFGALDFAGDKTNSGLLGSDSPPETGTTQFHRVDLRYDHSFSSGSKFRVATTLGYDRSALQGGTISDLSAAARFELQERLGVSDLLRLGADVDVDGYRLELDPDPTLNFRDATFLFPSRNQFITGAYADLELHPTKAILFRPGVRADVFNSQGITEVGVDPRLAASFAVSRKVRIVHTLGISHQTPNYLPNVPGVEIGGLRGGLQESVQQSAGVEVDFPEDVTASLTGFQQDFFNLSDPLGFSRQATFNADVASLRGTGYAYGAEVMVKRPLTRKLGGILSYTLSRSMRTHENITSLSAFDHTHVASVALSYDLGNRFRIGARGLIESGVPTSHITANGPIFEGDRGPWYLRLDLRVEKRWRLGQKGYWGFLMEVLNATATREVISRTCSIIRCTEAGVGPLVLPNVGVEAGY
ncbi:MAG TPA: TonB-dependent receptor plug domain-containing protein [Polyangiaceae bacterium]|nr:TonB-dependent receptor plug domain-containing protein [Polyangiaceae bacterium]